MNAPFLYDDSSEETRFLPSRAQEEGSPSQLAQASLRDPPLQGRTSDSHALPPNQSERRLTKRPPRPLNSYMLFLEDLRKSKTSSGLMPTTRLGGQLWRSLPQETKEEYKRRSMEAKQEHARRYPAYTLQPKKGPERRPYGSRKHSAQQTRRLAPSSEVEGFCSSHISQPTQEQMRSTVAFDSPHSYPNMSSPPPFQYNTALGLSHVPRYPPSQPFSFAKNITLPSPTTSVDHPLFPTQAVDFNNSPSTSPYISSAHFSTQTSPNSQSTPLTPYAYSPCVSQQQSIESSSPHSSPLVYFKHLHLNDEAINYAFTSTLPPAPILRPIALPEIQITDSQFPNFSEVLTLPQQSYAAPASANFDDFGVSPYYDNSMIPFTGQFLGLNNPT